jgi:hypothetical protein
MTCLPLLFQTKRPLRDTVTVVEDECTSAAQAQKNRWSIRVHPRVFDHPAITITARHSRSAKMVRRRHFRYLIEIDLALAIQRG